MHKFVVAGLKNNNVTEKIRKQLEEKEGEFTWFNDAYVDLVIYKLILFFDEDIMAQVKLV